MSTATVMNAQAIGKQTWLATSIATWLPAGPAQDQPHSQSLRHVLFPDERGAVSLTIEQIVEWGHAQLPVLKFYIKCCPKEIKCVTSRILNFPLAS